MIGKEGIDGFPAALLLQPRRFRSRLSGLLSLTFLFPHLAKGGWPLAFFVIFSEGEDQVFGVNLGRPGTLPPEGFGSGFPADSVAQDDLPFLLTPFFRLECGR